MRDTASFWEKPPPCRALLYAVISRVPSGETVRSRVNSTPLRQLPLGHALFRAQLPDQPAGLLIVHVYPSCPVQDTIPAGKKHSTGG